MRIEDAGVGMVLTQDVFDERGNLLLDRGIALTRTYISRLKRLGIRSISITDPYADSLKQQKIISNELREKLQDNFNRLFKMKASDILNFKPPAAHLQTLSSVVDKVIDEMAAHVDNVVNIQVRQPTEGEAQHAVNVCLLSITTGLYLKYDRAILQELALGSLLHDLGKSMLPVGDEDKSFLHTVFGRELLIRSNLSTTATRIAAEHHECYDGSGGPKGLTAKDVHPLSRLVAITNFFDTAMADSARNNQPRQEILEKMMAGGNTRFDLNLLRAFINTVAIFPIGSLVRLNTGRTAYVIGNRVHFPLRPMVRIIDDYGHSDLDLVLRPSVTITDLIAE